jgi:hypothetical protein
MVTMEALHALTAEMHSGFLLVAIIGIAITALCQIVVRLNDYLPEPIVALARKVAPYTEAAGIVGAFFGVIAIVLSAYTGASSWTPTELVNDVLVRNKILLTSIILGAWLCVVIMRLRLKKGLWSCPPVAWVYVGTAVFAFSVTALTGSMGAHLVFGGSSIDLILKEIGLDYTLPWGFDSTVAILLLVLGLIMIVGSLVLMRRMPKRKLSPKTCGGKWTVPKIEKRKK